MHLTHSKDHISPLVQNKAIYFPLINLAKFNLHLSVSKNYKHCNISNFDSDEFFLIFLKFPGIFVGDTRMDDHEEKIKPIEICKVFTLNPSETLNNNKSTGCETVTAGIECQDPLSMAGDNTNQFPCSQCNKKYRNRGSLIRHLRYECGPEKHFKCQFCPFCTKRRDYMVNHISRKHHESIFHVSKKNTRIIRDHKLTHKPTKI